MNLSEMSMTITERMTKDLDYDEEKKEIIAYGIGTTTLTITAVLLAFLMGLALHVLLPVMTALICGGSLRKVSGGVHLQNPVACLAVGTISYSGIGIFSQWLNTHYIFSDTLFIGLFVVSLLIVIRYAPVDSESKPIISPIFRKKLKFASVGFVLIILILVIVLQNPLIQISATLGILYQVITLLPILNQRR